MTDRSQLGICLMAVGLLVLSVAPAGHASELTDVVDAMDGDDLFDIHIEPRFRQRIERGTINREANCTPDPNGPPDAAANSARCPDEAAIIFNKELDYERVVSQLDIEFQIGMWRDLEFHFTIPIVFSDRRTVEFATGGERDVDQSNSSIDPANEFVAADLNNGGIFDTYRLFGVEDVGRGPSRSGLGDMRFGFSWSPFNQERQPHLATLTLTFDYVAPTGEVQERNNTGVGRGVHEIQIAVDTSRRFSIIEPYFGVRYILPLPSSGSLFEDYGGGQVTVSPGQRGEVTAGAEFILYENPQRDQLLTFDAGFDFAYHGEGRDYSPLSDALGLSGCNGLTPNEADFDLDGRLYEPDPNTPADSAACAWILQQPSNQLRNPALAEGDQQYFHDGITNQEAYAVIGGHAGVNFQISEYVELRVNTAFTTETEHFLTAARTGRDRDGDDEVDFNDPNERNPVYNPTLDGVGRRLRVDSVFNFSWSAVLAFQF